MDVNDECRIRVPGSRYCCVFTGSGRDGWTGHVLQYVCVLHKLVSNEHRIANCLHLNCNFSKNHIREEISSCGRTCVRPPSRRQIIKQSVTAGDISQSGPEGG